MQVYALTSEQSKKIIADTSSRLFNSHFGARAYITGDEIIDFSPFQQINKFILFQIYQEWNLHVAKLVHPYFDFRATEVKDALLGFQNILSKHIRIEKAEFRNLLDKSVFNNFRLILNPKDLFCNFFFINKDEVSVSHLEKYVNYFADFDFVISSILSYCKNKGLDSVDRNTFIDKLDKVSSIYEQRVGHSVDNYRSILFHKLTGLEIKNVLSNNQNTAYSENAEYPGLSQRLDTIQNQTNYPLNDFPTEIRQNHDNTNGMTNRANANTNHSSLASSHFSESYEPKPIFDPQSVLVDHIQSAEKPNNVNQERMAPANNNTSNGKQVLSTNEKVFVEPHTDVKLNSNYTPQPISEAILQTVNGDSKANNPNNSQNTSTVTRVADRFQSNGNQNQANSILNSIQHNIQNQNTSKKNFMMTIDQMPAYKQFGYIQRVFGGSKDRFYTSVNAINECKTFEEAHEYMRTHVFNLPDNSGRLNDPEILDFIELVKKNF